MNLDGARSAARRATGLVSTEGGEGDSAPSDQATPSTPRAHAGVSLYTSAELAVLRQAVRILDSSVSTFDQDLSGRLNRAIGKTPFQQRSTRPLLEGAPNEELSGYAQLTSWPSSYSNAASVYSRAPQGATALDIFHPSLHNSNAADLTSPRRRPSSFEAYVSGPADAAAVVANVQALDPALNSHPISTNIFPELPRSSGNHKSHADEVTAKNSRSTGRSIRAKCSIPAQFCSNSLESASDARPYSQRNGRRRSRRAKEPVDGDNARPCRKGPLQNEQVKAAAALTRKLKACIRCRFNKTTCSPDPDDPSGQCLPCRNLRRPTLAGLPCFRYIITDASLYREQNAPYALFTKRWSTMEMIDIDLWQSPETKTITITQDFGGTSYDLQVREFVPLPGDLLEEVWTDNGIIKTHKIPPYAIADMEAAAKAIQGFVDRSMYAYIAKTAKEDSLLWDTYLMAFRQLGSANVSIP
ncbi:hypothetical protein LTS15_008820 [Exophiala xenobiotica]|nr:hypothetical protein LTS15_008820 [Exophiala xenobiotica]